MRLGKATRGLALAMLCLAPAAQAQQAVDTTRPEAVVAEMSARMRAGDWAAAAALFDDEALRSFRGMMAPLLASTPETEAGFAKALGVADIAALAQSTDAEFFAAFMRGLMARSQAKLEAPQILGGVAEGADVRHVVMRNRVSAMGMSMTKMEVVSLRRRGEAWKVLLSGEIEGMAKALQAALGAGAGLAKPVPAPAPQRKAP